MLRVPPSYAWKFELAGRKRASVEFVAATGEPDVEMQAREQTPPSRISFPCAVTVASGGGGRLNDAEQLVALFARRLRGAIRTESRRFGGGKGWRRDIWVGKERGWGDHMEPHMDHATLMMRSHAQGETWVHSRELGGLEVGGNGDNGGEDDAHSRSTMGSKG